MNNVTGGASVGSNANSANISGLYNPVESLKGKSTLGDLINLQSADGSTILNLIFVIIGFVFFFNLILAGWTYMMSSGDVKKASVASTNITNAFLGLVISFTAFLIVKLVTSFIGVSDLF
jgi:hypothetical protein